MARGFDRLGLLFTQVTDTGLQGRPLISRRPDSGAVLARIVELAREMGASEAMGRRVEAVDQLDGPLVLPA